MYRKKRNFGKRGSSRKNYMDDTHYNYEGKPESGEKDVKVTLSLKALKDLPHSSYSVKADPYTAALPTAAPYPIVNVFNRTVGGNYGGSDNLDGGNTQQYANSHNSGFLDYFDVMRLKIKINYNFMPAKPLGEGVTSYAGKQLIDEERHSIAEALSVLQSTTYTQMAINSFVVETDMPLGSAVTTNKQVGDHPVKAVYDNKTDVFYAMSNFYQIVLQSVLNTLRWHNSFRLKEGTAIRNSWDRETPLLNSFFGLMNKKSFLNLIDSINLFFEGEYVDQEFALQAGLVNYTPSRRSNAMTDPVLEIQTGFNHCSKFKVYATNSDGSLIWDGTKGDYVTIFDLADLTVAIGNGQPKALFDVLDTLNDYLSLEATTLYGRTYEYSGITDTDNARFNVIKKLFDHVILALNNFKPRWADFRQALDTFARAGMTRWAKGFRPSIEQNTDAPLFRNLLCDDIYRLICAGAKDIVFNNTTKRMRTYSLWNMYNGTPEYDSKSGGAFLTYSFKNIVASADDDSNLEYLPIIFELEEEDDNPAISCVAVSRKGTEVKISTKNHKLSEVKVLNRLVPLSSQADLEIRVPTVEYSENENLTVNEKSTLYKTLTQVFGLCNVQDYDADDEVVIEDFSLDPDIIAVYQIEIEDTTNMSVTYARNCGCIKGTTSPSAVIGFAGISK